MMTGTYGGPHHHLWGKTALLRQDPELMGGVYAQFNDMNATIPQLCSLPGSVALLGFGWHWFPRNEWSIDYGG